MRWLSLSIARPPHTTGHPLDKPVPLPQFLELFGCKFQPCALDQNREPLGRNRLLGHDLFRGFGYRNGVEVLR
jgi:hypothetical protein